MNLGAIGRFAKVPYFCEDLFVLYSVSAVASEMPPELANDLRVAVCCWCRGMSCHSTTPPPCVVAENSEGARDAWSFGDELGLGLPGEEGDIPYLPEIGGDTPYSYVRDLGEEPLGTVMGLEAARSDREGGLEVGFWICCSLHGMSKIWIVDLSDVTAN